MTSRLLVRRARVEGDLVDLRVVDATIAEIRPTPSEPPSVDSDGWAPYEVIDVEGRLVVPPLVNGHAHLDKTFWGAPWRPHRPGRSVRERVAHEQAIRATDTAPQAPRSCALARAMAYAGVGVIRTHVDVDTQVGLSGLEAALAARAAVAREAQLQIVAFPQSGILADPGVADLMREAMISGADVVGGLDPWGYDGDVRAHLDVVFGLADRHDAPIDLHLHDRGRAGLDELAEVCRRAVAAGMQGRVAVSHAYALGDPQGEEIGPTLDLCAEAGVAIMTDGPVGMAPPVLRLRQAGVTVFSGSDGIRDAWSPYGGPGMMQIARQVAYQNELSADDELAAVLDLVVRGGATALGLGDPSLAVGRPADLVVIDAECPAEAVAGGVEPSLVLRAGPDGRVTRLGALPNGASML